MEAEARYTWVGAAVLALVAALVAAVLWLKDVGGKGDFTHYTIHFEQQALDGLEVGAAVSLRGIKVGRVDDYALVGDKVNRVRVEVRIDRRAPVRTNTVAVVTRNIVTGIATVTLVTHEPPGEPLTQVPEGERHPVIGEGRSDLEEIAGRVNKVGEIATVALNNINRLLSTENRDSVMATVASLRNLADGINQRLSTLDSTLQRVGAIGTDVSAAARSFGSAASAIETAATGVGSAAQQLGQTGDRVAAVAERGLQRVDLTLAETERTLAEARRALGQIAAASDAVQLQAQATAKRLEDTATGVDDQLAAAMAELRLSVETATRVFDRLREPRAALLGPGKLQLGPGESLP